MAREILAQLVTPQNGLTKEQAFDEFRMRLQTDEEARRNVDWFFFINMYDVIKPKPRTLGAVNATQRPSRSERIRASRDEAIERSHDIRQRLQLMSLTMPNGKELRDCTGAELATFGNRFKILAERVGKQRKVSDVLTEDDLQSTFNRST